MPGPQPEGETPPEDGSLPARAVAELARQGELGWYVHVPYCRTRCGYCDFNTYTADELSGAPRSAWAPTAVAEVGLARRVLAGTTAPAPSIFFGGGTPSALPPQDLGRVVRAIEASFGLQPGAEITVEANPDDVTGELLDGLLEAGANRISLGMQSADPATLRTLDRTHRATELPAVVQRIRAAGFERLSVDLIYGTPGETQERWERTLAAALALRPDHISAYCLGIEDGTRLGALVRTGRMPPVDPDAAADRYEATDRILRAAGLSWYEISNWAREGQQSRHNLSYWRGGAWWGIGPGAHSHIGGVRWWNHRHPRQWTAAISAGRSPAAGREVLTDGQRAEEAVMLLIRLSDGIPVDRIPAGTALARDWVAAGLAEPAGGPGAVRLTVAGRLIADRLALAAITG